MKTPFDGHVSRLGARDSPGNRNNGRRNARRDEHPAPDRHTRAHCPKDAPARHAPSSRRATHANAQWQTARPSRVPRAPDLPGNHPGLGLPQPCAPLQSLPSALRSAHLRPQGINQPVKASTTPATHRHARPCTTGGPTSRRLSRTLSEQQRAATAAASSSNSSEQQQQQRTTAASSRSEQQQRAAAASSNSEQQQQ